MAKASGRASRPGPIRAGALDTRPGCDIMAASPVAAPLASRSSIPCTSAAFAELSTELLRAGKWVRFQAHGASMWPLVRDGDVLLVRPAPPREIRVGDVVLCGSAPGHVVVHRVIRAAPGPDGTCFTIQGDQVAQPDGAIPAAQVYGRVAAIERGGARLDMDHALMRWLGYWAVLRSRGTLGRGRLDRLARILFSKVPGFSRYLA